jgi:hypothetical protein
VDVDKAKKINTNIININGAMHKVNHFVVKCLHPVARDDEQVHYSRLVACAATQDAPEPRARGTAMREVLLEQNTGKPEPTAFCHPFRHQRAQLC